MSVHILQFIKSLESNYPTINIHVFQKAMDAVTKHYYHYREAKSAHPSVELFLRYFYPYREIYVDRQLSPELEDVIEEFLEELDTSLHQKRLRNLKRSEARNSTSVHDYINKLFRLYSKLLVVRVDVHYGDEIKDTLTIEEAIDDRDTYLRAVKRRYRNLLGYVWKLEYGVARGYHYHMAFIFNGNKVQGDISLGRKLGEEWKSLSREPRTYYNCNADRNKYEEWGAYGIGMVRCDDLEKRHLLLHNALSYLLKFDEALLAVMYERFRSVGKMEVPHRRGKGGRPRVLRERWE
ncbi:MULTISPECIES: YagK/YfjJ domain-containing protein [Aeromonas]|uniref:YagK/YfjJ domain-containing protein n=1 Tax=Aeromonas TaxID=642 RepID=UPI001C228311|nr:MULTISPECIES: inovirus-type Gp2 protein [Aeromonas]MBX9561755.1 inovirus Gp2 family protein [Aeromonas hydrophila]QWZ86026.1 inovirus Gp2 family protein [Aeromonas sp. FDAARGOS 1404]UUT58546.1 inovirus Gp2 family protein [Aeromonas hydrophila]